ncbi:LysM peptidoglycan-binding domain-containing protein [bacterium]|nr:LysM peptidoglycan-binding domain-containing protein [bacterium]
MIALIKHRSSIYLFVLVAMVVGIAYATTFPPNVNFVVPSNGATLKGEAKIIVSFSGVAEHPVTKIEIYVDRSLVEATPLSSPLLSGEQTYFLNTLMLTDGPHSLTAKAYSSPEDVGECTITFYVNNGSEDITPPLVEILYPKDQQKVSGKVEVKIKAQDDREVKYVMLFINDKFKFLKNYPPFNDIWDTTRYPNGLHILQAFAYDAADNKGESKPVRVIVDNPSGQTTLAEESTSTTGKEEIAPPLIISQPPTEVPQTEKPSKEVLPAREKSSIEPAETSKDTKPINSQPLVNKGTTPRGNIGEAVATSGTSPKETEPTSGKESKIALTLTLPRKETIPSSPSGVPTTAAMTTTPKEVEKSGPSAKGKPSSGIPVLPPVPSIGQTKSPSTAPITAEKGSASLPGKKMVVSASPKSSLSKEGATSSKHLESQKNLLIVSKPENILNIVTEMGATSNANYKVHTIQKGEYLLKIARAYGVPLETIVSVNNIQDPNLVREGEKLLIPNVTVFYNNSEVLFPDAHPFVQNDLPLVPFRAIFETAGGLVIWHADSREVEAQKGDKKIWLKIGSRKAQVNEQTILMEVAAFIKFNRTYVPATLFHYALDAEIQWDPSTGKLYISAP